MNLHRQQSWHEPGEVLVTTDRNDQQECFRNDRSRLELAPSWLSCPGSNLSVQHWVGRTQPDKRYQLLLY